MGSTTPATSAHAMAPSTALPPARMMSMPASVDSGCAAQIIPRGMAGFYTRGWYSHGRDVKTVLDRHPTGRNAHDLRGEDIHAAHRGRAGVRGPLRQAQAAPGEALEA